MSSREFPIGSMVFPLTSMSYVLENHEEILYYRKGRLECSHRPTDTH